MDIESVREDHDLFGLILSARAIDWRVNDSDERSESGDGWNFQIATMSPGVARRIGDLLLVSDRELRRAAAAIQQGGSLLDPPSVRPMDPANGELILTGAKSGSFEVVGFLTDALIDMMNNEPLQAVLMFQSLWNTAASSGRIVRSFLVEHVDIRIGRSESVTVVEGGSFDHDLARLLIDDARSSGQRIEEFTLRGNEITIRFASSKGDVGRTLES